MRLSICIATFNRAEYIGQTLEALIPQLRADTELVVVDGASPDATAEVVASYARRSPQLVFRREPVNCGVDQDFDKAVGYARGDYCWLMSDDDIPAPDAVDRILAALGDEPDLLVVNAEVRDKDLAVVLKRRQLDVASDLEFGPSGQEAFFACAAAYLSFIGAVVIRRSVWLGRERRPYWGSLFVHVGVIFQLPALRSVRVLAAPLLSIRYGNAMWSARGFEIWTSRWPALIWSFTHFSEQARRAVQMQYPRRRLITLLWYRAIGAFSLSELSAAGAPADRWHPLARLAAVLPAGLLNTGMALVCAASRDRDAPMKLYDLARAPTAGATTRWLARRSLFPGTGR